MATRDAVETRKRTSDRHTCDEEDDEDGELLIKRHKRTPAAATGDVEDAETDRRSVERVDPTEDAKRSEPPSETSNDANGVDAHEDDDDDDNDDEEDDEYEENFKRELDEERNYWLRFPTCRPSNISSAWFPKHLSHLSAEELGNLLSSPPSSRLSRSPIYTSTSSPVYTATSSSSSSSSSSLSYSRMSTILAASLYLHLLSASCRDSKWWELPACEVTDISFRYVGCGYMDEGFTGIPWTPLKNPVFQHWPGHFQEAVRSFATTHSGMFKDVNRDRVADAFADAKREYVTFVRGVNGLTDMMDIVRSYLELPKPDTQVSLNTLIQEGLVDTYPRKDTIPGGWHTLAGELTYRRRNVQAAVTHHVDVIVRRPCSTCYGFVLHGSDLIGGSHAQASRNTGYCYEHSRPSHPSSDVRYVPHPWHCPDCFQSYCYDPLMGFLWGCRHWKSQGSTAMKVYCLICLRSDYS